MVKYLNWNTYTFCMQSALLCHYCTVIMTNPSSGLRPCQQALLLCNCLLLGLCARDFVFLLTPPLTPVLLLAAALPLLCAALGAALVFLGLSWAFEEFEVALAVAFSSALGLAFSSALGFAFSSAFVPCFAAALGFLAAFAFRVWAAFWPAALREDADRAAAKPEPEVECHCGLHDDQKNTECDTMDEDTTI